MPVETQLLTQARGGGEFLEEIPAEIMTYGERLNLPGAVKFNLAQGHETATREVLDPGVHEVVVRRNKQVVWAGPLRTVSEPEKPEGGAWLLEFGGEGLWRYPWDWYVTSKLQFTADDQTLIAVGLLNHHQNKSGGDFGIDTTAAELTGVERDRTYFGYEMKNIGEAVQQLAEVQGGFDFSINPETREFLVHYPRKGSRKSDLIWDERNIRKLTRAIDASGIGSQVLGIGAGEAASALRSTIQDSAAVATYGLRQITYSDTSISEQDTLDGHVQRELSLFKNPAETIGITVKTDEPNVFSYEVGDEGRVVWPSEYDPINRFMRLVGRDIIWEAGEERAILYLETVQ